MSRLSDRMSQALAHYRRGDWTVARHALREAVRDLELRSTGTRYARRVPRPDVLACELRRLSAELAALAVALEAPPAKE